MAAGYQFEGEAKLSGGFTVGYLPQEPNLNPQERLGKRPGSGRAHAAILRRFD